MRKGLWSPDEDERLVRCITKYVHGSWSDIARKAGLDRCGKSCRRRWMNHLRPDLKRGKFSMDEINLIVQLQEALGNRWSDIASHLEGRTDNDIKNLWNTQIKKRLTHLKAQNGSSSELSSGFDVNSQTTYGVRSTHVRDRTSIQIMDTSITNVEVSESCEDDAVLRFGRSISGIMDCSCSASSCDGSIAGESRYNQENAASYWKPSIHDSSEPRENPMHISFSSSHVGNIPSVGFSTFAVDELSTENGAADHDESLILIRSYSSRSSINNPINLQSTDDFVHQNDLFFPENDDDSSTARINSMCKRPAVFLDNYGGNHLNFAGTSITPPSVRSTSTCHLTDVKIDSACGAGGGIDIAITDNDECCNFGSPKHRKSHINHEFNPVQPSYINKFRCSPKSNTSVVIEGTNSAQSPTEHDQVNNSIAIDTAERVVMIGGSVNDMNANYDDVVPAITKKSDNRLPLMWEGTEIDDADQNIEQRTFINCTQGWEMIDETSSNDNLTLPQFSLPDWCKHLLQGDLL